MTSFVDSGGDSYTPEAVIKDIVYMETYTVYGELENLKAKQKVLEDILGILLANASTSTQLAIAKNYNYTLE